MESRVLGLAPPCTAELRTIWPAPLVRRHKYAEAQQQLEATLQARRSVLRIAHPNTRSIASSLETVRSQRGCSAAGRSTQNAAHAAAPPLPAGTGVLVQRPVAKPEHNGKRARCRVF
jgi:hypothetical protein